MSREKEKDTLEKHNACRSLSQCTSSAVAETYSQARGEDQKSLKNFTKELKNFTERIEEFHRNNFTEEFGQRSDRGGPNCWNR